MDKRKLPSGVSIAADMRYFNLEASLSLQWCSAQDFDELQIPATTERFEMLTFYMQYSYLILKTIRPNKLGGFGVLGFATFRPE